MSAERLPFLAVVLGSFAFAAASSQEPGRQPAPEESPAACAVIVAVVFGDGLADRGNLLHLRPGSLTQVLVPRIEQQHIRR